MTQAQQESVARLRQHFSVRVINEARYLVEYWHNIQRGSWTLDDAQQMQQAAQRLLRHAQRFDQPEHVDIAESLLQCMEQVLATKGRLITATIEALDQLMQRLDSARLQHVDDQGSQSQSRARSKPLYLAIADRARSSYLASQLAFYGIQVEVLDDAAHLRDAFRERYPLALVMDVDFASEGQGLILSAEIQSGVETPVPVIFYSQDAADTMIRLAAVRTGGEAFLQGELDASELLEAIEGTTVAGSRELSRVLIVDDSRAQAVMTERVLNSAVIVTRIVNNPTLALRELDDFNPDLVILDMYMPECSGPELAKMMRQCNRFDSIPIIYQSGEEDLDKQLKAMREGADDFLTKPVRPDALIATVRNRVARARSLKARMVRDSLTGLYNHTHIQQLLQESYTRFQRMSRHLSVVMLDIDHFKRVNDTHGHPTGDRVIKSLAMLLKQRLRKSDLIGRYGGEEFALVLLDADAAQAANVVDELRERFMKMRFQGSAGEFTCTLSAGVAECLPSDDKAGLDWIAEADLALYQAKTGGRNQVVVAQSPRAD
ncbi:MAG: diguanylate cyclase [Thiopseudomonas sp.]|nr:diguanylate cyclase [Thiopseudomonas sp.]